jgi:NADH:ubiquinone oxidoreductase subunit
MGIFKNAFTWWNGASWGTSIRSRFRGEEVGRDDIGNVYFKHRKNPDRRWVIYAGNNDSSQVPPAWNAWLRGTIEGSPEEGLPARRRFEAKSEANQTGTMAAFRPGGSLGAKGIRPASTGDYQPWSPD